MKAPTNPLIFENPRDTLDCAADVLRFLQLATPSDDIEVDGENYFMGQGLVLQMVQQAISHTSAALAPKHNKPATTPASEEAENVIQFSS